MRTPSLLASVALGLALSSNPAQAQTPNTVSGGDTYASDGGAGARWWKEKAKQYPKCADPANEGATLTGQIVAEAYKKPEDVQKVNDLGAEREEVKHELQQCIAQNYGGVLLQGSAEVKGQGDPDDPDKKTPPLSGGTNKTGGPDTLPGYPYPLPPQSGGGTPASRYAPGVGGSGEGHVGAGREPPRQHCAGARYGRGHDRAADLGYERPQRVSR